MKRILISLLAFLLALSMLLVGCSEEPPVTNDPDNNGGNGGTQPPPAGDTTFTKTENYLPAEVYTQMKAYFESKEEGFQAYDDRHFAPLVSTDVFAISDCTVKSITIPVFSTGKADKDGNFSFSLYILSNAWATLRTEMASPPEPIVISVNAEEHGLTETSIIRKFIKVDLSEYNIKLSATQTLGFASSEDTLVPARVRTSGTVDNLGKEKYLPAKYLIDNWERVGYYYYDTVNAAFSYTDNSLLFDFELERTWTNEAAYNAEIAAKAQADADYAAKLEAVKAAYGDKCFSLIGDSISTFKTVTNNPLIHSSLSLNSSHYSIGTAVYDYTKTYWGRLSEQTGMDLCVINAWSGAKAYGTKSDEYKDNMLTRSYNLTTNAGKKPDVIILYYAVNDMLNSPSSVNGTSEDDFTGSLTTGNLYQLLSDTNKTKSDKEIVAEWFAGVQYMADKAGYDPEKPSTIKPGETFITWEGSYALSLQNLKRLYPDAELFSITLPEANHGSSRQPKLGSANVVIRALAEYFEVALVDQDNSEVNKANCHVYARDPHGLHPNGRGHAAVTKLIVEAMYEKLQAK